MWSLGLCSVLQRGVFGGLLALVGPFVSDSVGHVAWLSKLPRILGAEEGAPWMVSPRRRAAVLQQVFCNPWRSSCPACMHTYILGGPRDLVSGLVVSRDISTPNRVTLLITLVITDLPSPLDLEVHT